MSDLICPVPRCGKKMRIGRNGLPKGVCCGGCYMRIAALRSMGRDIPQPSQLTAAQLADLLYPVTAPALVEPPAPVPAPELYGDEVDRMAEALCEEPDRSGWPMLTESSNGWDWPDGLSAIVRSPLGHYRAYEPGLTGRRVGEFRTPEDAARALRARLPEPEPKVAPADNDRAQVEALGVLAPQPDPTNTEGDVWQELIDITAEGPIRNLMIERRAQGIAKYGRPLGRDNGRDHVADAIQEALDGMVYSHAAGRSVVVRAFESALRRLIEGDESLTMMERDRNHWKERAVPAERELTALRAVVREGFEALEAAGISEGLTLAERTKTLAERILLAGEAHRKDRDYWRTRAEAAEEHHRQALDEVVKADTLRRELCDAIGWGDVDDDDLLANVQRLADAHREQKGPGGFGALRKRVALRAAEGLAGDNSAALLDIIRDMLGVPDGR